MTQEFYIIHSRGREGPFDMVAIVRKIRNGSLEANTPLQMSEDNETKPAQAWSELSEFFMVKKEEQATAQTGPSISQVRTLGKVLKRGVEFLQNNQHSLVYSAMVVLLVILLAANINFALPYSLRAFAYMMCFACVHFILSCYMLSVLRMVRGQPVDSTYLKRRIRPAIKSLMLISLVVTMPCMLGLALLTSEMPTPVLLVGLFIFAVPGLFVLAIYSYAPLLIMDKNYDFWESMETSRKTIMKNGLELAGVIYALFVINFLAGLCILLPMTITLPVTVSALAETYDELLS